MAAALAGCSSQAAPAGVPDGSPGYEVPVCEPNKAARCVGPGGCAGGKLCGPDGTYGACTCDGDAGRIPPPPDAPDAHGATDAPDAPDATDVTDVGDVAADAPSREGSSDSGSATETGPDA
jgi:hypothetical protein